MNTLTENELREINGGDNTIVDVLTWIWEVEMARRRLFERPNGY